jgi:hypothetical protein
MLKSPVPVLRPCRTCLSAYVVTLGAFWDERTKVNGSIFNAMILEAWSSFLMARNTISRLLENHILKGKFA